MNRGIRIRRHYVTLARRSRRGFARERGFAIPARISRKISSLFTVETRDVKSLSDNAEPLLAGSSEVLSPAYIPAIQDPRMSFAYFVESKFIPEHVERKTLSGQTFYQSMLKHLLRPETVDRMFNKQSIRNPRLKFVPGWPYLDEVRLCDITSDHVRRILESASEHGYSSHTIKHIKNIFFASISYAQQEGCFTGPNPARQVKAPPLSHAAQHNLSISETNAILNLLQFPDREIALFCLTTDMNMVEICQLQWKHVNLRNAEVNLDGQILPPQSIAVRANSNRFGPESYKPGRNRNIDIPEPLLLHLKKLRTQAEKKNKNDFVLITEEGGQITPETIDVQRLMPIRRALGIPWLSWQVLRRARVSLLEGLRTQPFTQTIKRLSNVQSRPSKDSTALPNLDFVESLSHEIRTPLAAILASGENLKDGFACDQSYYGDLITKHARHLINLVNQNIFIRSDKRQPEGI